MNWAPTIYIYIGRDILLSLQRLAFNAFLSSSGVIFILFELIQISDRSPLIAAAAASLNKRA